MRERPILFSDAMVRAIIAGQKTQTRRVVTPGTSTIGSLPLSCWARLRFTEPVPDIAGGPPRETFVDPGGFLTPQSTQYLHVPHDDGDTVHRVFPRIEAGDRLWVRECWAAVAPHGEPAPIEECRFEYRADAQPGELPGGWSAAPNDPERLRWRPSIHMPRRACRLVLEVTEVRVERLQAITEDDARAEGLVRTDSGWKSGDVGFDTLTARQAFWELWDGINGERAPWESNPWVWVVRFRVPGSEPGCSPREAADDAENLSDSEAGYGI